MGVFTVGRQVFLSIEMPQLWWLADSAVDMDFTSSLYRSSTAGNAAATDFLSCSRASTGYATTSTGALTSFGTNTLRITDLGLLIEGARTNRCLHSQEMTDGTWDAGGTTVTADTTVAPDGTTTADTAVFAGAGGSRLYCQSDGAFTAGLQDVTWSVWVQGTAGDKFALRMYNAEATTIFDTGVLTIASTGVWVRYSITGALNIIGGGAVGGIDTRTFISGLPGTAITIKVWGGQFEVGSFASSYVPTVGTGVTRAADNITTSSWLQTAINAATGSLVAQTDNGAAAGIAANIVDSNGTNLLGFDTSNHALASMIGTLATGNTANRTTQDKSGLAWNASGRSLVLNGGTVATDASAQTPSATQHIGSSGSVNFAYAYIERLSAWTTKLADATLQGFTV